MIFLISLIFTFVVAYVIGNGNLENRLLNYLLLILLLIDTFYVGTYLLNNIPIFINNIIKYLNNMTSSLDAVVLVSLITGSITLLKSFYTSYSDNRNKRRSIYPLKERNHTRILLN